MKKLLILILSVFFTAASFGATENMHTWIASPNQWGSTIYLTNACNSDNVDVSIQLWKEDGSLLTNYQISDVHTTDSNGKISLELTPHQRVGVQFLRQYFATHTIGSGTVTSIYSKPGVECLVGGYEFHTNSFDTPNRYGYSFTYLLNSGKKF